ncbi:MAG: aminopeptidase [Pseudomonadales bacterium]|nr:aminopeptidase [Pseudomonadales bacterium]NIX08972.1 aminopeptidase [Pseudomonadales bacterium]
MRTQTSTARARPGAASARLLMAALIASCLAGCASLGYYTQAMSGQLRISTAGQPVDEVLAHLEAIEDPDEREAGLLAGLRSSREVLVFAERRLGLESGGSYAAYVELERPFVVWNVFAAPELSLVAETWCYLIVGCAPYRGYFEQDRAERFAADLEGKGLDVYVGGVPAYSTLGWFRDPLLSTFIRWPEERLAELLIHELAHSRVWVSGDVAFNEAFATFVGREGARSWIEERQGANAADAFLDRGRNWPALMRLLLETRQALDELYTSDLSEAEKRATKPRLISRARACYREDLERYGSGRYDDVLARLNNAFLVSLSTYDDDVPAFAAVFAEASGDWERFFEKVEALARLAPEPRAEAIEALREQQEAERGDDAGADDVECEALFRHGLDGDAARAEHDDIGGGGHGQHERAGRAHRRGNHEQFGRHARAHGTRGENRHQQGGGRRVTRGFGEEGDREADREHDQQHVQSGQTG